MNDENYEIEDLLSNFNKKKEKKKNTSKKKGNRGENELADIFEDRFKGKKFFRVIGSGARRHQVDLSEETKGMFTGDIVCPSDFKFIVECKYGYSDIEICGIFESGHKLIDEWLTKARRDADYLGKMPMVCWRKPHFEWLAILPNISPTSNHMTYTHNSLQWYIVALNSILSREDSFWFNK